MKIEYSDGFYKSLRRMVWFERTKWVNPKHLYRQVKWFYQRGTRGYADCDVWGFDSYLQRVIAGGVRQLASHHMGVPMNLPKEANTHDNYGWPDYDDMEQASKVWEGILEEIAVGFEAFGKLQWDDEFDDIPEFESGRYKLYKKQSERAMFLFKKYFENLWD